VTVWVWSAIQGDVEVGSPTGAALTKSSPLTIVVAAAGRVAKERMEIANRRVANSGAIRSPLKAQKHPWCKAIDEVGASSPLEQITGDPFLCFRPEATQEHLTIKP
jgi:hypothetical protein